MNEVYNVNQGGGGKWRLWEYLAKDYFVLALYSGSESVQSNSNGYEVTETNDCLGVADRIFHWYKISWSLVLSQTPCNIISSFWS